MSDVVPLHRNRDFRRLWVGEALSDLGANASALAFPLLVLAVTGSPFQAGLVGAASLAAGAVLSLPAGAIVDRFDRKRLMIYCDLSRFIALGGLGLAVVADRASLALILTAVVVEAAASTLFGPAHSAALRHIVPRSQLGTAAARNESRSYATSLAGGPIGGALFAVSRAAPFLADALTYLASLVAIARIRKPLEEERSSEEPRHGAQPARSPLRWTADRARRWPDRLRRTRRPPWSGRAHRDLQYGHPHHATTRRRASA